jgi:long-subunit fatty acid transport protein
LFWSNGFRISDDFSAGVKLSYIFSSIVNTYKNQLPASASPISYFVTIEEQTYIKDLQASVGFSFSRDSLWNKNYRVSVGLTADPDYFFKGLGINDVNATRTTQFFRASGVDKPIEGDTLATTTREMHLPPSLTFGVALARGSRWSVGTEIALQDWSSFKAFDAEDEGLQQSFRWSLGGEITPNPVAIENYLKRITYRLGVTYEKTPYMAPFENPSPVYDYGATFGLSLPAGRSSVDLAFKYGQRGDKAKHELEESYFRVYLGLTFNDQWFIKRKFD